MFAVLIAISLAPPPAMTEDEARTTLGKWKVEVTEANLLEACKGGRTEIVRMLLAVGISADTRGPVSTHRGRVVMTALGVAVEYDQFAIVTMLITAGANVERLIDEEYQDPKSGRWGYRPLHLASERGHDTVALLLLDSGAELEATDQAGRTALYLAAVANQSETVALLLAKGAEPDNAGSPAPLAGAAGRGRAAIVAQLLRAGARVNRADYRGRTALHRASKSSKNRETIDALIEAGAALNVRDEAGKTPRMYAKTRRGKRARAIEAALADAGAELTTMDRLSIWLSKRKREDLYVAMLMPLPIVFLVIGLLLLRRL